MCLKFGVHIFIFFRKKKTQKKAFFCRPENRTSSQDTEFNRVIDHVGRSI